MIRRVVGAIARHGIAGLPGAAIRVLKRARLRRVARSLVQHFEHAATNTGIAPRVTCPSCGYVGHCFCPIIEWEDSISRQNARCPRCTSLERHRLIKLALDDLTASQWNGRLLHFAPEANLRDQFLQLTGVEYVAADLRPSGVDCRLDIQALPFADESFDYICCSHVLEHVPDDRLALAEMRRILRPGGMVLICVPHDPDSHDTLVFDEPHSGWADHLRYYGRDFAEQAGAYFEVSDYSPDSRSAAEALRHGLDRSDMLLVCRRA